MKIYICGPITGMPDLNRKAFNDAAERLNSAELVRAVNPHTICADITADFKGTPEELWQACMKKDIAELLTCDGVALLPGFSNSRGARLEVVIAESLGIQVHNIQTYYDILGV